MRQPHEGEVVAGAQDRKSRRQKVIGDGPVPRDTIVVRLESVGKDRGVLAEQQPGAEEGRGRELNEGRRDTKTASRGWCVGGEECGLGGARGVVTEGGSQQSRRETVGFPGDVVPNVTVLDR